jgi:hypothetical protein
MFIAVSFIAIYIGMYSNKFFPLLKQFHIVCGYVSPNSTNLNQLRLFTIDDRSLQCTA